MITAPAIRRTIAWQLCIAALYLAMAKLGLNYAVIEETVTLFWPPSGIALAATLLLGYRIWPGIALGAFLANIAADLSFFTLVFITFGNTVEPLVGAWLINQVKHFSLDLDKVSDVLMLLLIAAIGSTTIGASFGSLGLLINGELTPDEQYSTWLAWWLGDGMGVLVITPFILSGLDVWHRGTKVLTVARVGEALVLTLVLVLVALTIFGNSRLVGVGYFPICLSMFPFAIWSALRFGSFGASSIALLTSLIAIYGTARGQGPFVAAKAIDSQILWCLFADLMSVTGLMLAALDSQRKSALVSLAQINEDLAFKVEQRTLQLSRSNDALRKSLAAKQRLQLEMQLISEERQRAIGQELHDGLGQQLTGIDFLLASLHQNMNVKAIPEASIIMQVKRLLDEAILSLRTVSRGLYPVVLETGGLSAALRHLAETTLSTAGISCSYYDTSKTNSMDKTVALNLYRIAQEAISNALHHSGTQQIDVHFGNNGDHYRLVISDNGIGFLHQNINDKNTLGLRSMRSRAELIGAVFEVHTQPGGGTEIIVEGNFQSGEADLSS